MPRTRPSSRGPISHHSHGHSSRAAAGLCRQAVRTTDSSAGAGTRQARHAAVGITPKVLTGPFAARGVCQPWLRRSHRALSPSITLDDSAGYHQVLDGFPRSSAGRRVAVAGRARRRALAASVGQRRRALGRGRGCRRCCCRRAGIPGYRRRGSWCGFCAGSPARPAPGRLRQRGG
jgi:hypothetical protein